MWFSMPESVEQGSWKRFWFSTHPENSTAVEEARGLPKSDKNKHPFHMHVATLPQLEEVKKW
jgi:hypothetical protein